MIRGRLHRCRHAGTVQPGDDRVDGRSTQNLVHGVGDDSGLLRVDFL